MTVSRLYRISERLYDESYDIASANYFVVSEYAGHAAYVLNQASSEGISASSKLLVGNKTLCLPRLRGPNDGKEKDELYFDVLFPAHSVAEDFEAYAAKHNITPDERMSRALRLTNYILSHADVGTPMHFYRSDTGNTTPVTI
jgi:hypothetical protein